MQPTEARDIGDAPDDRSVPAIWPRPTHVEIENYLPNFLIIDLKLATEGSKARNRKVEVRPLL
jgi:hypothetical protein